MKKADKRDNQLSFSLDTAAKRPAAGSTAKVNVVRLDEARVQKARKFLMEQLSKAGLR